MDLNKVPKKFCDNIRGAYTKEFFVMLVCSGEVAETFALTPQHVKRLDLWLRKKVEEYEKQFGVIDPGIQTPIPSPMQSGDFGTPPSDKKDKDKK